MSPKKKAAKETEIALTYHERMRPPAEGNPDTHIGITWDGLRALFGKFIKRCDLNEPGWTNTKDRLVFYIDKNGIEGTGDVAELMMATQFFSADYFDAVSIDGKLVCQYLWEA